MIGDRCSFCRLSRQEVRRMVVCECTGAAICDVCTRIAVDAINAELAPATSLIERAADKEPPPSAA